MREGEEGDGEGMEGVAMDPTKFGRKLTPMLIWRISLNAYRTTDPPKACVLQVLRFSGP